MVERGDKSPAMGVGMDIAAGAGCRIDFEYIKYVKKKINKKIYLATKRIFDICGSICGIIVLGVPMLIIALVIFLQDGGNPIYKQTRIGKDGKEFNLYKFRSMEKDPPRLKKILTDDQMEQYKKEFKIDDDPRITPFGDFIRKTSLDELPQMFNILFGKMSIIGPRPVLKREIKLYGLKQRELLSVKPGLTGYWQAYGRNNVCYEDGKRQEMELYYVRNQSVGLDMKIFFKTIVSVLKRDGAQ